MEAEVGEALAMISGLMADKAGTQLPCKRRSTKCQGAAVTPRCFLWASRRSGIARAGE